MPHKIVIAFAAIISFFSFAKAQSPAEKTLLWQVSGKEIAMPSYLYGTLHLMCPDDLKIPAIVKEKFWGTKQLYLEIDLDEPGAIQEMMKSMTMHDTSTLQSLLGDKFERVSNAFQGVVGMPLTMMSRTKPLLLMSMIYPSILGCQPDSWESVFMKMAKENNREIKGLEKLSDQVAVFEKIPYHIQATMLKEMMLNLDSAKIEMDKMQMLYKQKDVQAMQALTTEKDFAEYESILVNDRNKNWIPVIVQAANKMPSFFAFGAGHLGGEDGVIQLLRNAGYKVSPVYYD